MLLRRLKSWFRPNPDKAVMADADKPAYSIPVLCYHSWTLGSGRYEGDDHVALARDLELLGGRGYRVLPLPRLVEMLKGQRQAEASWGDRLVGLSFDDGRDHDYVDTVDAAGRQVQSMHAVLEEGRASIEVCGGGPMAVSFVIASPEARRLMDKACGDGRDQWRDVWWAECAGRGLIGIANHSWDHVHDTLPEVRQRENRKGSFLDVDSFEDAEAQIADAQRYIAERTGGRALPIFGYPYGHVPAYLRDEYFPAHGKRIGVEAAFGTGGVSVRPDSLLWDIPRFVCGWHWRNPEELEALLDAIERGER